LNDTTAEKITNPVRGA